MKQFLAIVIISISLISCKKSTDETYAITALALDWDTQAPIAGAKIYAEAIYIPGAPTNLPDSALSDVFGRAIFRYTKTGAARTTYISKDGYESPLYSLVYARPNINTDRTDTLFLAKTSWLDIQLHRTNTYQNGDILNIWVEGYRRNQIVLNGNLFSKITFAFLSPRSAVAVDSTLHVPSVYFAPPLQKAYINWQVNRGSVAVASGVDSVDMVQFGTRNYTLNY